MAKKKLTKKQKIAKLKKQKPSKNSTTSEKGALAEERMMDMARKK